VTGIHVSGHTHALHLPHTVAWIFRRQNRTQTKKARKWWVFEKAS